MRAQRADYYENNVGRFLSIEGYTTQAQITCTGNNCDYTGPPLVAEYYDAAGNRLGGGTIDEFIDPGVSPDYYQYHFFVFRVGNRGDGGALPASIKIGAPNGDSDTMDVREWIAQDPPPPGPGFLSGFLTHYNDSQEAYKKMRDLAAEFPNISQVYELPEKTRGYQRKAQTMLGYNATASYVTFDANNLPVAGAAPNAANQARTVVLTSKAYGHQGGNVLTAQLVNPGAADSPLSVSVTGNAIRVGLATDTAGAITSTAAQIVAALNANPAFAALATASLWRTSPGNGVVLAGVVSPLSDLLRAPATVARGPQTQTMLRIGKQRDGSKVGVFLYCQEHGNEIATSGVCLETAERLVRNYGTDPETTRFVDELDIFLVPQINGDGATHSIYDSNRRTNLSNWCEDTTRFPSNETDPASRNGWGVDLNRNFSQGSIFDGFVGATFSDCTNGNFSGMFEFSEPETRNESWVQTTFRNIKFVNNIHSSGGFFMWPPGAYTPQRVALPYPSFGTLNFFDQTGKEVLDRIKSHRRTAILPQQTGPVIDVLYSAAGNSADEAYYSNGIIGFDFEIGAQHFNDTGTGNATCNPGQQPPFGTNTTNPCLLNEGFHEAMEFASGNYGLLEGGPRLLQRHHGADRRRGVDAGQRRARLEVRRGVHERRGGVHLLHDRRLDADHGLYGVQAATGAGAAGAARAAGGHDAQVDRPRLQGQHVGGEVAEVHPARRRERHGDRHRAGHALARGEPVDDVRRVHAGRHADLPHIAGHDRDLDRGRRDAERRRPEPDRHGPPGERRVRAVAGSAGTRRRRPVRQRRLGGRAAEPALVERADVQRERGGGLQPARQQHRSAADGHVQQDADVHAVDDEPIGRQNDGRPLM